MFDSFIACSSELKQLEIGWLLEIPALVRVPVFSDRTGFGYVVVYVEKTREYQLQCFDPSAGRILWQTGVVNGGYGAPAIGDEVIAVPTGFVVWRLALRRVISSGVASKECLPEYDEVARRG